jgi:uncharacterized protein YaaN involved in tellurite resistance
LQLYASDIQKKSDGKSAVENMGADLQRQSAKQSEMLKQPIKRLSERGAEGGDVANALVNLKMEVEELDPGQFDFEPGWFSRALGNIPGVGTPLKRYFSRYESAQTVISAIISSLEKGREQLQRDNVTLSEDQKRMIELSGKLERAIKLGQLIDQKLQYSLERDLEPGSDKYKFVAEELLFPLRQRLIDLQQQLVVNQQGVLATEIIIRNNVELVRGVNRALNVTVSALRVAATVALALANQKIVLDKIEAVNKTTSDLIAGTAARLKTQGAAIHKQASSAQIDMEALKGAFVDIRAAMDDIATFRMNALPQMANTVLELDRLSTEAGKQIADMQKSKTVAPELQIAVE